MKGPWTEGSEKGGRSGECETERREEWAAWQTSQGPSSYSRYATYEAHTDVQPEP